MKYIFKPIEERGAWPEFDWYESTPRTPALLEWGAGFALKDFRRWFLQWVFK